MKDAYREYIHTVQEALTQQDADTFDTNTLVAIAQSFIAAASLTPLRGRPCASACYQQLTWMLQLHPADR